MNFETMSKQRKMILIAAAVGVICMFLPWVSVFGFSVSGMHGWGILVFLCLVVAGVIAFMGDQTKNLNGTNWMAVLIAGGVASLIMLINFISSLDALSLLSFGYYGALAASIGVAAFAFMNRSATDSLQGGFDSLKGEMNRRMNSTNTNQASTTNVSQTTPISHTPPDDPSRPTV